MGRLAKTLLSCTCTLVTCFLSLLLLFSQYQWKRANACPSSQRPAKAHRPGTNAALRLRQYCAVWALQLHLAVLWECAHYCPLNNRPIKGVSTLHRTPLAFQLMVHQINHNCQYYNQFTQRTQYITCRKSFYFSQDSFKWAHEMRFPVDSFYNDWRFMGLTDIVVMDLDCQFVVCNVLILLVL